MKIFKLKKDGKISHEVKTDKADFKMEIPQGWGYIEEGWRTAQQLLELGLLQEGKPTRTVIDKEAIPESVDSEGNVIPAVEAIFHTEYFVPANYTIEVEDTESEEYKKAHYVEFRAKEYPSLSEQMDMRFWDEVNGTTVWKDLIASIKAKYPKA